MRSHSFVILAGLSLALAAAARASPITVGEAMSTPPAAFAVRVFQALGQASPGQAPSNVVGMIDDFGQRSYVRFYEAAIDVSANVCGVWFWRVDFAPLTFPIGADAVLTPVRAQRSGSFSDRLVGERAAGCAASSMQPVNPLTAQGTAQVWQALAKYSAEVNFGAVPRNSYPNSAQPADLELLSELKADLGEAVATGHAPAATVECSQGPMAQAPCEGAGTLESEMIGAHAISPGIDFGCSATGARADLCFRLQFFSPNRGLWTVFLRATNARGLHVTDVKFVLPPMGPPVVRAPAG